MLKFANLPLLVIEDDPNIWTLIEMVFAHDAYRLLHAWNGAEALEFITHEAPELILSDVLLPDTNGLDLCRFAKSRNPRCQVLLMTSLGQEIDKVLGLEAGADDYITKPFSDRELRARVRSAIRRIEAFHAALDQSAAPQASVQAPASPAPASGLIEVEDLRISTESYQAWRQRLELDLTRKEFDLLCLFASHPGKVYTRQELIDAVWPDKPNLSELSINGHIRRLREKVDEPFAALPLIDTVRGVGYRLRPLMSSP